MLYVFLALALLSGCALTYAASGFASLAALWQVPVFFLGSFLALVVLFLLVVLVSCLFVDPKKHRTFWTRTFVIGVVCFIPLYYLSLSLPGLLERTEELRPMSTIVSSLRNFSFMCVLVSSFIFLWQWKAPHKVLHGLVPYGKMSLTNYLTQSMVGSFIYFGYGLSLYDDLGTTASFAVGILLFILQLGFCHWWLAHHKQGPFEGVWRKATWMFS